MKKILVTGAGGPAGVNFLKSLKLYKTKWKLFGTDVNNFHLEFGKSLTEKMFLVPRATSDDYIPNINKIITQFNIDLIHPQPDIEVFTISENRNKIEAKTFLPKKETIRICQNKYLSASIWKDKNFPSVKAMEIRDNHLEEDISNAFEILGDKIWLRAKKGAGGTGSTPAENIETSVNWIKYWRSRGKKWEFIAQEYLPGRNLAFQSIFKDGELITSQARERIEYIYPYLAPSGVTGTPIVAKTIHDDNVNKIATQAVLAIDSQATGVFCVDLKENKSGETCPTEINAGRFFTTSYFFSYAAKKFEVPLANMPYVLVKLAFKESIPEGPRYNILPKDLYWIRHIDCSEYLIKK